MSKLTEQWLLDPASIKGILVEAVASIYDSTNFVWVETTLYLSNIGYLTTDSLTNFNPVISGGLQVTESLSLDNSTSMSFGDISLNNQNGELDDWLDATKYIWVNRTIKVYLGDPAWVCANLAAVKTDFELIFNGVISDIDSSSREVVNIKVQDKLQRLNTPITENKLGIYGTWSGGQNNEDTIRPIVIGEVFNITPLQTDPSQLEYMFCDTNIGTIVTNTTATSNVLTCVSTKGFVLNRPIVFSGITFGGITANTTYYIKTITSSTSFTVSATSGGTVTALSTSTGSMLAKARYTSVEKVIEIRDNGIPIQNDTITSGATIDLLKGTFKLLKTPVGTVTMSVQGITTNTNLITGVTSYPAYKNTIANAIANICTQYGNVITRLASTDIDLVNFNSFDITNTFPIGYYISDRDNVLNVCQSMLASLGAQLFMTKQGLLQILRLGVPTSDTVVTITDDDMLHHSLSISSKVPVVAANSLGYAKNWTIQSGLTSNIPSAHKDMLNTEWFTTTITDLTSKAKYSLDSDPVQKDTMLITSIDADIEATRLTNYYKTARVVYKFTGTSRLLLLKLGQGVILTHNRFNLDSGKSGQVISLGYNWLAGTVDVEVLI